MNEEVVLQAKNITKRFAGLVALQDAQLELRKGEVHALVGANGAGKSTLIKIIMGAYKADEGEIFIEGKPVKIESPIDAKRMGVSAVYQEFSLINSLTVAENIYMGNLFFKDYKIVKKIEWTKIYEQAEKVLSVMDTYIDPKALVGDLSVGQRQLVEIAKALSNNSKILIMDEPTAALTDNDVENMFKVVKSLTEKGISIIYVSHRLEELPVICNRVSVYRDGRYIKTMNIEEAPKPVIIENMVGKSIIQTQKVPGKFSEKIMEIKNFTSKGKFEDIELKVHKGEILGITGLAGAGRTELARAIFGVDKKDSGEVFIHNKQVNIKSPLDAKQCGIGFITEDRKEEGLILNFEIQTNMTLTILKSITKKWVLQRKKETKIANDFIESLKIKTSGPMQLAKNLSGGNQQKVIIAKWLATNPSVLIMDEPTRGIDVGSKSQVYGLMNELAEKGMGIIVISSEIPEILEICDRILVMAEGKLTAELINEQVTQEQILNFATTKS